MLSAFICCLMTIVYAVDRNLFLFNHFTTSHFVAYAENDFRQIFKVLTNSLSGTLFYFKY